MGKPNQRKHLQRRRREKASKRVSASNTFQRKQAAKEKASKSTDVLPILESRECGGCTGCCTTMMVDSLEKPAYTPCEHQCETGCGIHPDRPDDCKHFECLWKINHVLRTEYRPDKSGFLLYLQGGTKFGKDVLVANETKPGALTDPAVKKILQGIAERLNTLIILLPPDEQSRTMIGPPILVAKAAKIVERELKKSN